MKWRNKSPNLIGPKKAEKIKFHKPFWNDELTKLRKKMRDIKNSIWNITRESLVHKHLWFLEDDELLVDEQNGYFWMLNIYVYVVWINSYSMYFNVSSVDLKEN